jgi:hypothetical protein
VRVRKLDAANDMTFGGGQSSFWVNQSAGVAQAVRTTLLLFQGEWFLDTTAGVPWNTQILGAGTTSTYDAVIRAAILSVQGVTSMVSYSSSLVGRKLTVNAQIVTAYSTTPVTVAL